MGTRETSTPLAPTAAFVTALARDYFLASPGMRSYFENLDLSNGDLLIEDHKTAGIHEISSQLMCNRKFAVREAALRAVRATPGTQVVILAAGLGPLGFEILAEVGPQTGKQPTILYEVDTAGLDQKKLLQDRLFPDFRDRVCYVTGDIRDPDLLRRLPGFDANRASVVVLEGITHYLPMADLAAILKNFRSADRGNTAVIEFGPPFAELADWVRPVALQTFGLVEKRYFATGMTKFNGAELKALIESIGGEFMHHERMDEIERARTGRNAFFPTPDSGWVEVATARL